MKRMIKTAPTNLCLLNGSYLSRPRPICELGVGTVNFENLGNKNREKITKRKDMILTTFPKA